MDAKQIADQFIGRGGRTKDYGKDEYISDLLDLSGFLTWAEEDGAIYSMVDAKDALRAMGRLLNVDIVALRKINLGYDL